MTIRRVEKRHLPELQFSWAETTSCESGGGVNHVGERGRHLERQEMCTPGSSGRIGRPAAPGVGGVGRHCSQMLRRPALHSSLPPPLDGLASARCDTTIVKRSTLEATLTQCE